MTTSTFKRAMIQALSTRTVLYTCPSLTTAICFDGQVTNIDSTNKISHFITIEVWTTSPDTQSVSYHSVFKELEVPYGLTTPIPKMILTAGEIIYVTSSDATNNTLEIGTQIIERV